MLFVRCSEMGRKMMKRTLELQITHAKHPLIDQVFIDIVDTSV